MTRGSRLGVPVVMWLLATVQAPAGGGAMVMSIDSDASKVVIEVGKAGLLGFAGHAHEVAASDVRGQVVLDTADPSRASVALQFMAAALRVTGKGEPAADVGEVQRVMQSDRVLDSARFPTIAFRSRRVSFASLSAAGADVSIEGDLTLHGETRPMTIRAKATFDPAGGLTARGACSLRQSDFGMTPVTAAGGAVRVSDEVQVQFEFRARPSDDTRSAR